MGKMIFTPFAPRQVESLNDYQSSGRFHKFTCVCGQTLRAAEDGWTCPNADCQYTQNWAHDWMADRSWESFETFHEPT